MLCCYYRNLTSVVCSYNGCALIGIFVELQTVCVCVSILLAVKSILKFSHKNKQRVELIKVGVVQNSQSDGTHWGPVVNCRMTCKSSSYAKSMSSFKIVASK